MAIVDSHVGLRSLTSKVSRMHSHPLDQAKGMLWICHIGVGKSLGFVYLNG